MSVSSRANEIDGVHQAFVAMGTPMNKEVLRDLGLMTSELEQAGAGDLMIVVETLDAEEDDALMERVESLLQKRPEVAGTPERAYRTLASATDAVPDANLAVISVAGAYAAREARRALQAGLHVMLFSDNVTVEDELDLKRLAHEKGLLMMGPDCGTAIINGVGLCFANAVRRGTIGIVAASGTGSQEVSVRIDALGAGVSQLIGTGGRDVSEEIGGLMMLDAMRALDADPGTDVVVLVSKPPAASVEASVLAEAARMATPVVACFLGGSGTATATSGVTVARTTEDAARAAVRVAGMAGDDAERPPADDPAVAGDARARLRPEQRYIRGLFCGGTLCDEAMYLALERHDDVFSNIQKDPDRRLDAQSASVAHTFLDLGDDDFTNGRPHPMIDPSTRVARLRREAEDPEVAVIAMDFILGYGAHEDPAGAMLPAIADATARAVADGRHLEMLAYVLGTERDRPRIGEQTAKLEQAGVRIARSSTHLGLLARDLVPAGETR
jgi:succinyl-CoA synthetase alpha subunit